MTLLIVSHLRQLIYATGISCALLLLMIVAYALLTGEGGGGRHRAPREPLYSRAGRGLAFAAVFLAAAAFAAAALVFALLHDGCARVLRLFAAPRAEPGGDLPAPSPAGQVPDILHVRADGHIRQTPGGGLHLVPAAAPTVTDIPAVTA